MGMGMGRAGTGPVPPPAAVALQQYRRRPRLGVLRQGGALLGLLLAMFAALQGERAVVAQCTGGGLSDEVLCRALGKECGEVAGEILRALLGTPPRLLFVQSSDRVARWRAAANDLCAGLITDSCGTTITCPACEDNMICIDHSCCHPFPTCDDLESDCGYVEGACTLTQSTVFGLLIHLLLPRRRL
jgi:hypothetical protein